MADLASPGHTLRYGRACQPFPQEARSLSRRAIRLLSRLPAAAALLAMAGCGAASLTASTPPVSSPAHTRAAAAAPASLTPSPQPTPARPVQPLAGKVIVIDPGHNGGNAADPQYINQLVNVITESKACDTVGTQTDAGYPEHAFNFNVAVRLARLLRSEGAKVILTRTNDHGVGPCITQRAAIGNRAHADAAISIHADGGPPGGSGFDVIEPGLVPGYTNAIVGPSARLALDIRNAYHRITGEPYANYVGNNAIDVRTDLGGLNLSKVPKVFIECGNMRNAADAAKLTSPAFRQRIAVALAAGFTRYLTTGGAAGSG
jgi:N-acetylmuramoyl-L-alanine amidase